ncbi:OLC1v1020468C1 [Oldenlandia corymbosa var. corymbosa]|uniref:OLC1v1020468C1 n=1 Tax=Oldenlandia corymbosa var. corymbosa TaxID=529605 RepID=A0AAV1EGL7_OLDCO|nr:OLC1v1020468C1 [Oldenlandia corymbosa var. corymbosa]
MALRRTLLTFMVIALVAIPMGEAQLGGVGGLLGQILGGILGPLLGPTGILGGILGILGGIVQNINGTPSIIQLQGRLFCSVNGNTGGFLSQTPIFPNAAIQVQCGTNGDVVSTTTTNARGEFATLLKPSLMNTLLNNCSVAVATPLSTCNANLPSVASLISPITSAGTTAFGDRFNIFRLTANQFQLISPATRGN